MKKLFTLLLIFSLVAALLPLGSVFAANESSIIYTVSSDGTYAILSDASDVSGNVTIPAAVTLNGKSYPVKTIAAEAFAGSSAVTVTIPSSVTTIEDRAFVYCYLLSAIDFSGAACNIGNQAFTGSQALEIVSNVDAVTKIGYDAFDSTAWYSEQASKLTNSALYIGKTLYTFFGDASSFTIASGTLSVSPSAFEGNKTLESIDLSGIVEVGKDAFKNCSSLATVDFGNSLEVIGISAFDGCSALSGTITLPASVISLGANAFENCGIETADLSATGLSVMSNGVFKDCDNIKKVILPASVTKIENYSFSSCSSLSEINASAVTSIGYDAFRGCTDLSDKSQFGNVEYIASGAFDGTAIYTSANGTAVAIGKAFYKTEESVVSLAIDEGVKQISPYAFYNTKQFSILALPTSLEKINENAFASVESGNIFVFSSAAGVYEDLKALPAGTVYVPQGKTVNNSNISIGNITGISVVTLPGKTGYFNHEQLDASGIKIALNTTLNGTAQTFDIADIGYSPSYTYDFAASPTVTVSYCGYTATFDVTLKKFIPGDANNSGSVDTNDIVLLRKYVAGLVSSDDINVEACDLDGVAGITTTDLVVLRKILAGLIVIE